MARQPTLPARAPPASGPSAAPRPPIPPHALEQLYSGDYPGNVRELKNAVARAAIGVTPELKSSKTPEVDLSEPFWTQREQSKFIVVSSSSTPTIRWHISGLRSAST